MDQWRGTQMRAIVLSSIDSSGLFDNICHRSNLQEREILAKQRNNIICLPCHKIILLGNGDSVQYAHYAEDYTKHTLARAVSTISLAPGEQLLYKLPHEFKPDNCVAVTPRLNSLSWLRPTLAQTVNNAVYLTNSSTAVYS